MARVIVAGAVVAVGLVLSVTAAVVATDVVSTTVVSMAAGVVSMTVLAVPLPLLLHAASASTVTINRGRRRHAPNGRQGRDVS